jgi:hypothetical protein
VLSPVILYGRTGFGWTTKDYADMVGGDVVIGRFGLPAAVAVSEYALLGTCIAD